MADSEFLRSIDARVARTNELIEADRLERERAAAGHAEGLQDVRVELRQMSLRGERLAQGYLRALEEMSDQARANSASTSAAISDMSAAVRDMSAAVRDMSDQIRANTRALLVMLDERGGGGPAAVGT